MQIQIEFTTIDGEGRTEWFEATGDVLCDIQDTADELEAQDWELIDWEGETDPNDFDDLNKFAEYAEKVEEHGEAYRLRYEDIGENQFSDEYQGCYESEEAFAQSYYDDCYEIPDHLENYIDWERVARDMMMDYSSYEGNEGTHIFRC